MLQALCDGIYEVLCALRGDEEQIAVVACRQSRDKSLALYHLTCLHVDVSHRVTCKIKEELLATGAHVGQDGRGRFFLGLGILIVVETELGEAVVVVRMFPDVFLPQEFQCDMLALHLLLEIGKQCLEYFKTPVGICRIATLQTMFKHGVVEFEKTFYTEFIGKGLLYVVVHGLLVDADYCGRLAVGDSLLLQEQ